MAGKLDVYTGTLFLLYYNGGTDRIIQGIGFGDVVVTHAWGIEFLYYFLYLTVI